MANDELDAEETEAEEAEEETEYDDDGEGADDESDAEDDGEAADDEDEDSDEEDSADDESEDDDESDEEEAPRAAAKKTASPKGKSGKRNEKRKSAAARLAAARAAKAAKKAAKRGKEQRDEREPLQAVTDSRVGQSAVAASSWAAENRPTVYGIVAAVAIVIVGAIGWTEYSNSASANAGGALADAIEIRTATIRGEDEVPDEDDDPSYTSTTERAEAALAAYEIVINEHGDSAAADWAELGRGETLLELERYSDAREAFDAAIESAGDDGAILWRALEGRGFTYEAEEDWSQALETYEELSRIDDMRFEPVAKYHMARMYIAQGETDQATETLSTLVESLRGAANTEDEQEFAYVLAQAEVRLRELDPSAVPARPTLGGGPGGLGGPGGGPGGAPGGGIPGLTGGGPGGLGGLTGGGPGGGQMSPEQLQQLIERFQQQQQQGGGGEGE